MKAPHKHAELIKAWADGADIEGQDIEGHWYITFHPDWRRDGPYRVYKEPSPDIVRYGIAMNLWGRSAFAIGDNLKVTFDSETRKLKSAEVIS